MRKRYAVTVETVMKYVVHVEAHNSDDAGDIALDKWGDNPERYQYSESDPEIIEVEQE